MSIFKRNKLDRIQHKSNPFFYLQNELNKTMNNFYNWFYPFSFPTENIALTPAVDIIEDNNQFKVEAEMPGMDEEDINVSIDNGYLNIKGEKTISEKNKDKNYMSREISYGSYERRILLPDSVDTEKASASFKKGMLWVMIPKKAESIKKSRSISVEKAQ